MFASSIALPRAGQPFDELGKLRRQVSEESATTRLATRSGFFAFGSA
jgi:hypothetical protein